MNFLVSIVIIIVVLVITKFAMIGVSENFGYSIM